MAKRSSIGMGSLMRKKLSDITNNHSDSDNIPSLQQLLNERSNLLQLLSHKDEIIESNGAELRRLQSDIKKLQLQNSNLAHSNTLMLAELNLGRNRIKTLQHEISCRNALIKENAPKTVSSKQNASKEKVKDNNNRRRSRRNSGALKTHEHEAPENLFEIEDTIMLNPCSVGGGESLKLRNEGPRNSFGRPLRRRAAEKVQSYKEVPLNVKMRRVE